MSRESLQDTEPVGIVEIAERLGVARPTVDQWRFRNLLPTPDWPVGGRDAWQWSRIRSWAILTGRLAYQPGLVRIRVPAGMAFEDCEAVIIGERDHGEPAWVLHVTDDDGEAAETVIGKRYAASCVLDPGFLI